MNEGLKRTDESLSRSWKVDRTHEPFYDGKKGICNKSLTKYYSLYNDNLLVLNWPSGTYLLTHSLTHSLTYSFNYSPNRSAIYSLTDLLANNLLANLLDRSLTHLHNYLNL